MFSPEEAAKISFSQADPIVILEDEAGNCKLQFSVIEIIIIDLNAMHNSSYWV